MKVIRLKRKKRCETCKHWERNPDEAEYNNLFGVCHCNKYINRNRGEELSPINGVILYNSLLVDFQTGEDFGCVHWKTKEKP